ncbi:MAG: hypothetical protein CVU89_06855 [Firmicutes bacterium HGW-Firmicutes-14]|nr:MAG: hypothetical protein CVU89_06855 [Firmicutes bacterium HGW-Firmicutes-14]
MNKEKTAAISAVIYTGISLGIAVAFYLAAGLGRYDAIARFGGAAWVFILSMIITMPVVIPRVKSRQQQGENNN